VTNGPFGAAGFFFTVTSAGGSFELQLDTPNAATSPSTITVDASRSGVQNFNSFNTFFDM
jgi:hypothetical protein